MSDRDQLPCSTSLGSVTRPQRISRPSASDLRGWRLAVDSHWLGLRLNHAFFSMRHPVRLFNSYCGRDRRGVSGIQRGRAVRVHAPLSVKCTNAIAEVALARYVAPLRELDGSPSIPLLSEADRSDGGWWVSLVSGGQSYPIMEWSIMRFSMEEMRSCMERVTGIVHPVGRWIVESDDW